MYSLVFICLIAAASAAPYHHGGFDSGSSENVYPRPAFGRPPPRHHPGFGENYFDTKTFWENLASEMKQMDDILREFYQHFPRSVSREGVEGNQYKIVIPLAGYKEEEITVKARTGVLMIQAVQKTAEGNQRSYLDVRTLPECFDLSGTWSYDEGVLTIQFPVKKDDDATQNPVTELTQNELPTTEAPNHSREEMGHDDNESNLDVDVGNRGDNNKENELETNDILRNTQYTQSVEATTYAVDLKNEVEFVPVHY